MRDKIGSTDVTPVSSYAMASLLVGFTTLLSIAPVISHATAPITSSGLNTQVNVAPTPPPGKVQYDITGGYRAGTNLFHSFGQFNVPTNNIANFLNDSGLTTANILGRVTDGNPSNIFGTIQTTGFGGANLFLMNPAGIVFGPNATLNVGGSVTFTTANYLRLADNALFNAIPNEAADALLSAAPVAAYGFLGSNPGAITVQGSQFTVTDGAGISLVGGNIAIQSGTLDNGMVQPARLLAPNGQIQLASAASPGEFNAATLQALPNVDGASFSSFGSVILASGSNINVSGANTVSIRSGQFVLSVSDAVLSTAASNGDPETISLSRGSSIVTSNSGADPGADVQITAGNLQMDGATIQTLTTGDGMGGSISITGQSISLTNGAQIISGSQGTGSGGEIAMTATNSITIAGIDPEGRPDGVVTDLGLVASGIYSTTNGGKGGEITIATPRLVLSDVGHIATLASGEGEGGDILINSPVLTLMNGARLFSASGIDFKSFSIGGAGAGGNIIISDAESIALSGYDSAGNHSRIRTETWGGGIGGTVQIISPHASISLTDQASIETASLGEATAGNIQIEAATLNLSGGAGIGTSGSDIASSGNLDITAHSGIFLSGGFNSDTPSRIVNENEGFGGTGTITISTGILSMDNGARILSDTFFDLVGPAIPKMSITADSVALSNSRIDVRNILTDVGSLSISAPTISLSNHSTISTLTAADGNAGPINLSANNLSLSGGSQLISSSSGAGGGGKVTIQGLGGDGTPALLIAITGQESGIFTTTSVTGTGGDINLSAQSFAMQNGGTVSAKTTGSGNAGNIMVKADTFSVNGGATITAASTGSGAAGSVTVEGTASPAQSVLIDGAGSGLFTDTQSTGAGGNIFVNANSITLQNGGTFSAKTSGSAPTARGGSINVNATDQVAMTGGATITASGTGTADAGNISINAGNTFMMTDSSVITKSDNAGGGNIAIRALDQVRLVNSHINASAFLDGGNIMIDPNSVILQNSQILAQAIAGNGGAITIFTSLFLADQTSLVDASSQFGLSGPVNIQSPTSNLAGSIASLPSSLRQTQSLQTGRCAALYGETSSSFVVAGRDTVPTEPGGWEVSPMASSSAGAGLTVRNEEQESLLFARVPDNQEIVSLRRLTPAGFLTHHFAESAARGCRS